MVEVHVVRVFVDSRGSHGNPLGVVLDAAHLEHDRRQHIARTLDYSETIFVDDVRHPTARIFTRQREIPFAGHPVVGVAWLLARLLDAPVDSVHLRQGTVGTWRDGEAVWVRSLLATTPAWWHERLPSPEAVDRLDGPLAVEQDATQLWAWEDEAAGVIRARTFGARFGTPEDEATGSASMRLAAALGRDLTIRHGQGSIVLARPGPPGYADLGGLVVEDEPRSV